MLFSSSSSPTWTSIRSEGAEEVEEGKEGGSDDVRVFCNAGDVRWEKDGGGGLTGLLWCRVWRQRCVLMASFWV